MNERQKSEVKSVINEFVRVTQEISRQLGEGDFDGALASLKRRDVLFGRLKEEKEFSHWASKDKRIASILEMDAKNTSMLNQKMAEVQEALATLEKERQSVHNLQSISKVNQKRIVDFLY